MHTLYVIIMFYVRCTNKLWCVLLWVSSVNCIMNKEKKTRYWFSLHIFYFIQWIVQMFQVFFIVIVIVPFVLLLSYKYHWLARLLVMLCAMNVDSFCGRFGTWIPLRVLDVSVCSLEASLCHMVFINRGQSIWGHRSCSINILYIMHSSSIYCTVKCTHSTLK